MPPWNLDALATAAAANIRGDTSGVSIATVATDSRSVPVGSLFVALRGERFDGHDFARDAVDAGAQAVLVDNAGDAHLLDLPAPRVVVTDTLKALGDVAAFARNEHGKPVVAITGSNGKTTTKELCAAALGASCGVHQTLGNYNNLIGLPLTLLGWGETADVSVVEMGMNAPGEIARLTQIAAPDVGLVTNASAVHLEGLGSIEHVARAKAELYAGLAPHATAILNADDAHMVTAAASVLGKQRLLRFGFGARSDVRIIDVHQNPQDLWMRFELLGTERECSVPLFGQHNAHNVAAAVAVAIAMGVATDAALEGLRTVQVPGGRMKVHRDVVLHGQQLHVIDDTYNANPASVLAAVHALMLLATGARTVVVLGDMLELGPQSEALHEQTGKQVAAAGATEVYSLGTFGEALARGARQGGVEAQHFEHIKDLMAHLNSTLQHGDWVLAKGSRGMRMERVIAALMGGER